MKSIKDLLKRMNESDKFDSTNHHFIIYSDGSGMIKDIKSWSTNEGSLNTALNDLDSQLNEDKESWTL